MIAYRDLSNDSGVESYEIGEDYIDIKFSRGSYIYRYSVVSAGQHHVNVMKDLAVRGDDLNTYINKNTKKLFETKFPSA